MSERASIDRLAEALEAAVAGPPVRRPDDLALDELVQLAAELNDLPDPAFRARLRTELLRRAIAMATALGKTAGEPVGTVQSVTVYLAVHPAVELIEFVKRAFAAEELLRTTGSGGGLHAEIRIGDATLMIGGGERWRGSPAPTALHLYVPDADRVFASALEAGASLLTAPTDQPYGDREACVVDIAGNHWYIATHLQGGHVPPGLHSVTPYLHPRGASALIDFLQQAFAGDAMQIERGADGTVIHAKVRVGGSVIEMGEAHGDFGPMPTMFYAYVDDVDGCYRRALAAGATSLETPALQPYGERRAAVRDPFDNQWYLAARAQ